PNIVNPVRVIFHKVKDNSEKCGKFVQKTQENHGQNWGKSRGQGRGAEKRARHSAVRRNFWLTTTYGFFKINPAAGRRWHEPQPEDRKPTVLSTPLRRLLLSNGFLA